jgi:hypothetical protein
LLLLSVTTWAALHAARHIAIYALVAAPILSNLACAWWGERTPFKLQSKESSMTAVRQVFNGFVLAAFLMFAALKVRNVLSAQIEVENRSLPVSAVSFLSASRFPGPLFNNYNWGGYIIWRLYPEYRVYIDGRADLYGDQLMDQFASTYHISNASWRLALDQWGIQTVILPPDAPMISALRLRPDWKLVYGDSQAIILRRAQAPGNQ